MKIEGYTILTGTKRGADEEETAETDLEVQVGMAIDDGWQPLGAAWGNEKQMWQTMVRYEQPEV